MLSMFHPIITLLLFVLFSKRKNLTNKKFQECFILYCLCKLLVKDVTENRGKV